MEPYMSVPAALQNLRIPVIGAPLFIIAQPELVLAQCKAGIVGSFPALNARPKELLDEWLTRINDELAAAKEQNPEAKIAPYAVNQIVHGSNDRLEHDVKLCVKHKAPLVITSLRPPGEVVDAVHSYGGLVFHDVISVRHAEKAIEMGVDGLILVCTGAGGHAGTMSPFALVTEVRKFWNGPIALSGAMSKGEHVLAAQAMGADFAYMGTRFIATKEGVASDEYKQSLVDSQATDIIYSNLFTGVHGNYLKSSIVASGLDPDNLPAADKNSMNFASSSAKAWRDIWGAGQSVSGIDSVLPAAEVVNQLVAEYEAARKRLAL
jgi:nitronate monooxygenase